MRERRGEREEREKRGERGGTRGPSFEDNNSKRLVARGYAYAISALEELH
jgi:hypothetical protein